MAFAISAMAQYTHYNGGLATSFGNEQKIYYGLRLGLGLSTVNSDDDRLDGGNIQAGLVLGGIIGFQLAPASPVYLESGLIYTEKGGEGKVDGTKWTYDLNYLEMPITVKYKYDVDGDLSVCPFAGGYLAMGIAGDVKNYGHNKDDRASYSSFSSDFFSRFDGGLRFGCGLQYQLLYIEMAYDLGLANISHDDFESSRNGCFYINCGVNF